MNILKITFFAILLTFAFVGNAYASGTNCSGYYGGSYTGSTSCNQITIDKKVQKPGTKDFVDNLSALDPKYNPGQEVTFQVTVQNTGTDKLTSITVTDFLPQFVTFVAGPGNYDKDANKLTFVVASLESGESQTIYIKTKVADTVTFSDNGFTCVTNVVRAEDNGMSADDSAGFCIARPLPVYQPVLGMKQTPSTGPVDAALPILVSMAGAGMFLTRKTRLMLEKKRGGVTK